MATARFRFLALALAGLCLLAGRAHGWPMWDNERVDRALQEDPEGCVVVAGRITAFLKNVLETGRPRMVPELQHIVFEVEHVPYGASYTVGAHLRFSTRTLHWPNELVPIAADARAYLIVDPTDKADHIAPFLQHDGRIRTVVPWSGEQPPPVKTRAEVERLLADELGAAISHETSVRRRRELVRQATPILTAEQARTVLVPLLESPDEWLRHAAIAGLAYASPTPANVERAVEDLRAFMRQTAKDAVYQERVPSETGGAQVHITRAYHLLGAAYAILESNWRDAEVSRLRPLLPLYRVIASEGGKVPDTQWFRGIEPLLRIGDQVDLPVLYHYYASHETREGGPRPEAPSVRYAVLRRLAELLHVEVVVRSDGSTLAREKEQWALIREAYTGPTAPESEGD